MYERVTKVAAPGSEVRFQTNRFTLLENGLHCFDDGAWKESEDVIEVFPDGAIARRGPWAVGQQSRVGDHSATTLEPGGAAFGTVQQ